MRISASSIPIPIRPKPEVVIMSSLAELCMSCLIYLPIPMYVDYVCVVFTPFKTMKCSSFEAAVGCYCQSHCIYKSCGELSLLVQCTIDVLWGQLIKLIQVASNSELRENQRNNLLFFEIVPSHCFGASEVQT